jgi:lipid A 3-O-deacylase
MNHVILRSSLFLAGLSVASVAFAGESLPSIGEFKQVAANGFTTVRLNVDNDSLLLNKDDGFYTSGIQISSRKVLNTAQESVIYGWQLGQDLYTASDIKLRPEEILPIDHPYVGWIFAGVFRELADSSGKSSKVGVDIGCLGACAGGERTQTLLHKFLQQPLPKAWNTQLQQEWGVVLSGEWSPVRQVLSDKIDLQPRLKGHFGNIFTDASIETTIRYGSLNNLPEQMVNCLFLRGEIKAIGYDATLQGGYFNKQAISARLQRSVGELELGFQWRSNDYGLFASIVRRSSAIKDLSNALGAQNFARVQFIYVMK